MGDNFHGSFKHNVNNNHADTDDDDEGIGNNPYAAVSFFKEVENVKEDITKMEKLYVSLQESNEGFKTASTAQKTMELRTRTNEDLDSVLKLAKQINKKHDALVRMNAAQRKVLVNGAVSSNDQKRAAVITEFGETIQEMMRSFQGMRVQMETDHRQVIESRYFSIVREKATEEAIDNLVSSQEPDILLHKAIQEYGQAAVLDTTTEIQERRNVMKEIRKSLMDLHQMFLGMATPIEAQPDLPSQAEPPKPAPTLAVSGGAKKLHVGGLNDFERRTRFQAYIALAIAAVVSVLIVITYLLLEMSEEENIKNSDPFIPDGQL